MKLLFFPKYTEKGPSSRYRIYQYLNFFKEFNIKQYPFFDNSYNPGRSYKNIKGLCFLSKLYFKRLKAMLLIKSDELVFVQYEFTPFLPFNNFFFKIKKINYIVDFDDAAFHEYDQHKNIIVRFLFKNKIVKVVKNAKAVITGSPYLTNFAQSYNKNVFEIPTSINFEKYSKNQIRKKGKKFIIGWIGSNTTSKNVLALKPVFEYLRNNNYNFEVWCVGFNKEIAEKFKNLPFKIIPWEEATEVEKIKQFSVGIMPLENTLFNRGKCAFKLIQYMACGLPTISTPLEANVKVNRDNANLFANSTQDWIDCIVKIIENPDKFHKVGLKNIEIVKKHYTIQLNEDKYKKIFKELIIKKE